MHMINKRIIRVSFFLPFFLTMVQLYIGCSSVQYDFDAYDYQLESMVLGVAFPPVQDEAAIGDTITACDELGMRWVRLQESWVYREPERDVFSWGPLDTRITMLHAAGIHTLLTLGGHEWPSWLGSTGGHTEADTLVQFREYVAALLLRYSGTIDRIQFGNEWNWEIDDYMGGDEAAYVAYANILYDEVYKISAESRPTVVLGSLNGLAYLAFDQGLVGSIEILGQEPYEKQIGEYIANPDRALSLRAEFILGNAHYDMLDIHLYDDYSNWPRYLEAIQSLERDVRSENHPVLVSEFGGPYPRDLYDYFGGKPSRKTLAKSLVDYMHTLDSMDLEEVYFFSLAEDPSRYHCDSYLVDALGIKTASYEVLKRFALNN